jgi:uncharacterized membrane protein
MAHVLDRGSTVANQQQSQKSRAQAARKGSGSRGAQATTASRGAGGGSTRGGSTRGTGGNGSGQVRASAARPAGRPPRATAAELAAASHPWTPGWLPYLALVLSLIGLGLGIFLTIAHLAGAQLLPCANHGVIDCAAVTTSPESKVFGIFPVAELGLGFFFAMTLLNLPWVWRPVWSWLPRSLAASRPGLGTSLPVWAWRLRLAGVIVGVLFILYLIYTELITLREICLWCTATHITTFLLFVLLIIQAAFWGDPSKAPKATAAVR